jgi:hypothetical protein
VNIGKGSRIFIGLKVAYNNIVALPGRHYTERQNRLRGYDDSMINEKFYGDKKTYAG